MKILLVTDREYWKKNNGANLRINNLVNNLKKNFDLKIYYLGDEKIVNLSLINSNEIYSRFKVFKYFKKKVKKMVSLILKKEFLLMKLKKNKKIDYMKNKNDLKFYQKILEIEKPDIVIFEYIYLNYFLESTPKNIFKVIDTHDIQSERKKEFDKKSLKGVLDINFDEEIRILNKYDLIMTINERDKKSIQNFLDVKVVSVLYPAEIKEIKTSLSKEGLKLGFIGGEAQPNILGIQTFIQEVFFKIDKSLDIELNIYGSATRFVMKSYDMLKVA